MVILKLHKRIPLFMGFLGAITFFLLKFKKINYSLGVFIVLTCGFFINVFKEPMEHISFNYYTIMTQRIYNYT